jgi:hypothetical protein
MTRHSKRRLCNRLREWLPLFTLIWLCIVFGTTMHLSKSAGSDTMALVFIFLGAVVTGLPVIVAEKLMSHPKF